MFEGGAYHSIFIAGAFPIIIVCHFSRSHGQDIQPRRFRLLVIHQATEGLPPSKMCKMIDMLENARN
jgi:hypothetical protein